MKTLEVKSIILGSCLTLPHSLLFRDLRGRVISHGSVWNEHKFLRRNCKYWCEIPSGPPDYVTGSYNSPATCQLAICITRKHVNATLA